MIILLNKKIEMIDNGLIFAIPFNMITLDNFYLMPPPCGKPKIHKIHYFFISD